jgi:hypothetical protein
MPLQPIDPRGRPEPYRPPDREAWKAQRGAEPYIAKPTAHLDAELLAVLAKQASAYVSRDWSTMSAEESFRIRGNLDGSARTAWSISIPATASFGSIHTPLPTKSRNSR